VSIRQASGQLKEERVKASATKVAGTLVVLVLGSVMVAQSPSGAPPQQGTAAVPQASQRDVKTVDGIISAVYEVISGPAGQKRDWNRFRSLFLPEARLIPTPAKPSANSGRHVLTVEEYIQRSEPFMLKEGFFETEVSRRTEQFGNIAHVWSTYESRSAPGQKPFARGINSIQLVHDGERWWVMHILWHGESAQYPLPPKYLER